MGRHSLPGQRDRWYPPLPRREPGLSLPADLVPEPRTAAETPPLDVLAKVLDGLCRLDPWEGLRG